MADLDGYGIDRPTLERMYAEWKAGASKSALERRYLGRDGRHGKLFTSLVRRFLDRETEERHLWPSRTSGCGPCCAGTGSTPAGRT